MLKKLFRARPSYNWNIIEKETVDEVIFRTSKPRNRLMLELMARGGMRIKAFKPISAFSRYVMRPQGRWCQSGQCSRYSSQAP
jgi:hypothetical protein